MRDTLVAVVGYGCAAVHVGVLRRVVVVNDDSGVIELINPVITEASEETQSVLESSIALGAPQGYITRPQRASIREFDRNEKLITGICY